MARGRSFNDYLTPEDNLTASVIKYASLRYPSAVVIHSPNEGRRTAFERFKFKVLGGAAGVPDLFFAVAKGPYHGLFLELKCEAVYLKDGKTLKAGDHLAKQSSFMGRLKAAGYAATFACGLDEAIAVIDLYMNLKPVGEPGGSPEPKI
jgi:hypothetical protein